MASQSGGMGFALLDLARDIGLGVHAFVSLGDRIDVSSNDLLAAWMDDERVTAAALYLESFGNALKFARTARRFAERKPLLAVVAGRSRARLLRTYDGAGADVSIGVDALLTQSGVIACRTGAELTETALLLAEQPLPQGLRVGIVVNTGGLGALAMDLVDGQGLGVVPLSAELQDRLGRAVDARNPVDLGADVTPDELAASVGTLVGSGEVDAVLVLLVVTRLGDPAGLYAAVGKAREVAPDKPVLLVAPGAASAAARGTPGVTVFRTIESATGALARTMRYAEWRRVPSDQPVVGIGTRGLHARAWANARLDARGGEPEWLPADGLRDLLGPYGIHRVGTVVSDAGSAARVAAEIGFPVVVKVADPTEPHKADRGLVRVDVRDVDEIVSVIRGFAEELGQDQFDVLVQPLLLGHQVSVGVLRDPQLGSMVTVAAGGRATEGWDDEVALLPPVGPSDAARAVRALRLWPQVLGGRGLQTVDVSALESLVVAVGQIARGRPPPVRPHPGAGGARRDGAALRGREGKAGRAAAARRGHPATTQGLARTSASAWRAISHSSSVGMTSTATSEVPAETTVGSRTGPALRVGSSTMPSRFKARQRRRPELGTVLTDAAGEDDAVHDPERREVRADVLADPVGVDVERVRRRRVPGRPAPQHLAEVVVAGQTLETRLAVERPVDVLQRPAELAVQVGVDGRVEVPGPRAHHQTLEGCQSHGGVDRPAPADRRRGGAVAEVEHHQVRLGPGPAEQVGGDPGDEGVRGAVEPVTPDPVLVPPGRRDRVGVRRGRHRLVERGVEDGDLRHVREEPPRDPQTFEVGRVVQRRERDQLLDGGQHVVVHERRLREAVAAVDDAVARLRRCRPRRGTARASRTRRVQPAAPPRRSPPLAPPGAPRSRSRG